MNNKSFDKSYIKIKEEEIDKLCDELYENSSKDGIVNLNKYIESPIKILWILKELNDDRGYIQREKFNELAETVMKTKSLNNTNRRNWWPTMDPVIYISYQILNGFKKWDDIDYIKIDPSMVQILQRIAYINIKKEPGGSVSIGSELIDAYNKAKEIIRLQIDIINPDVIIGGNTINYLKDDYNLKSFVKVPDFPLSYAINEERLYIDSYHPQYLSRQNEGFKGKYFDAIVQIVKTWWDKK